MSDCIDKAVMLFVFSDLPYQKAGIQDQTCDNRAKEQQTEQNLDVLLPVEDDPTESNRHGGSGQQDSKRKEKGDLAAATDTHEEILTLAEARVGLLKANRSQFRLGVGNVSRRFLGKFRKFYAIDVACQPEFLKGPDPVPVQ